MNGIATSTRLPMPSRARLRLVGDTEATCTEPWLCEQELTPAKPTVDMDPVHVLVAGTDTSARSRMLAEMRNLLPASTRFLEASETWEVLARAAASQMVVLVDDLGELSSESLVRLLARRQPALPVLAVGSETPTHADAASA